MFGKSSGSRQKVARQKKDKFQTESLSYILSCLVGCPGDQQMNGPISDLVGLKLCFSLYLKS